MSAQPITECKPQELSVGEARNHFSERINRAFYGNEITYVTRGRNHEPAAAIVPMSLIEAYEALVDEHDARIARERLDDIRAGREGTIPLNEVNKDLDL